MMEQDEEEDRVSNSDLVWSLAQFSGRKIATNFVKLFENKLCIYSASVEQLYTNYSVKFLADESLSMKIVPDPQSYYDTFQNIPESAVENTGLTIIPGELVGNKGLHLSIPLRHGDVRKTRVVALQAGLKAINNSHYRERSFLPVIVKGDLRALQKKVPVLHLHNIRLDKMKRLSEMERNSFRKVILEKLAILV